MLADMLCRDAQFYLAKMGTGFMGSHKVYHMEDATQQCKEATKSELFSDSVDVKKNS